MPDEQNPVESSQPSSDQPEVEFVEPDPESSLFLTYSNHVQLGFTLFDIRLLFGEIVDVSRTKLTIEQRAQITMSWLQAKLLLVLVGKAVAEHEARNGEIKVPAGMDVTGLETKATYPV